jgi:protein-tyrosine phosphatase
MFSFFFKTNEKKSFLFSSLGTDIHSHLLPSIDDGARNMEDTLSLVRSLVEMGYKRLITTPHVMSDVYQNNEVNILAQLALVRDALKKASIDVEISAAAEYFLDEDFLVLLGRERLLTLFDNHVLVEMPFVSPLAGAFEHFFQIARRGYTVVLAHPERYTYYHQNYKIYHEIKENGIKLQLNLLSLTGYYGESSKKIAVKLLKDKLIDFIGTDTHHSKHIHCLNQLAQEKSTNRLLLDYEFSNQYIH